MTSLRIGASDEALHQALSRRQLLWFTGAAAGAGLLTACSPVGSDRKEGGSGASLKPRAGGVLKVGRAVDISTLDPQAAPGGVQGVYAEAVFDKLIRYSEDWKLEPDLAESFELSEDGRELVLVLREGVKFHSGRELTPDDVVWNIERLKAPTAKVTPAFAKYSKSISEISVNGGTVRLIQKKPSLDIYTFLRLLYIADRETLEGPDASKKAVGTGPYSLEEWIPGQSMTLARNKDYWMSGYPLLDKIESGQIQMTDQLPFRDVARLSGSDGFEAVSRPGNLVDSFIPNCQVKPLDNVKVRQALAFALDRERINKTAVAGLGTPTSIVWPSKSELYTKELAATYAFDLDKAKSLLQEAGVAEFEVTAAVLSTMPQLGAAAEIYRADLAKIGVTLKIRPVQPAELGKLVQTGGNPGLLAIAIGGPPDPGLAINQVVFISPDPSLNPGHFDIPAYTALSKKASDPALSDDERLAACSEATKIMLDEVMVLPMVNEPFASTVASTVHDVYFEEQAWPRLDRSWVEA